jgi:hypothetical protein
MLTRNLSVKAIAKKRRAVFDEFFLKRKRKKDANETIKYV